MQTVHHARVGVALAMAASAMMFAGGIAVFIVLWFGQNGFATLQPPPVGMALVATLALGLATFTLWFAGRLLAAGNWGNAANGVLVSFLLTAVFVGVQLADRFGEFSHALRVGSNVFHALFSFLTLLHLLHALLALLVLGRLEVQGRNGTIITEGRGLMDGAINGMLYLLAVWLVLMLLMFII